MGNWMQPTDPWPDEILSQCCGEKLREHTDLCSLCLEHTGLGFPSEIDDEDYIPDGYDGCLPDEEV